MQIDPTKIQIYHSNQENLVLPNNFKLSEDGKYAFKSVIMNVDGKDKSFTIKIFFHKDHTNELMQVLNNLDDEKSLLFVKNARLLGLGDKYKEISLSKEGLTKHGLQGRVKLWDARYFHQKELELEKTKDARGLITLEHKKQIFNSMQQLTNSYLIPLRTEPLPNEKVRKSIYKEKTNKPIKEKSKSTEKKAKLMKEQLGGYYIGNKKISDLIDDYAKKHPYASMEDLSNFCDQLLKHQDLHKK